MDKNENSISGERLKNLHIWSLNIDLVIILQTFNNDWTSSIGKTGVCMVLKK